MTDEKLLKALQSLGPAKICLSSTDYADLVEAVSEYQWVRRQLRLTEDMIKNRDNCLDAIRQINYITGQIFP